ncbi:hypothetical protein F383_35720 [Gossypium arboreum]|uniref:Uncharacterized protein n=1 Tax=Gossypium arboreum TaxID=29729 RepID=A0A0B0N9Q1_GOSAR|nr:hypothetical protein F383_35460 [Gossypium arboreum]KHG08705.1 hypothetical protein F383_35720 [Gossypium arboreum]
MCNSVRPCLGHDIGIVT